MGNNIDRPNRADADGMKSFIERIENINREKDSEKGSFMKRCATLNEEVKAVLDEAKAAGLSKASVKAVIKVRDLERKVEAAREDLEDDDAAIFDDIREALGDFADLPLGAAAVAQAEGKQDPVTAGIIDAVMSDEDRAAEKAKIEEQRKQDGEEFDAIDAAKKSDAAPADGGEGSIDPKAARANRASRKTPQNKGLNSTPSAEHVTF